MAQGLYTYIDRYLNDYIVYHGSHFMDDVEDVGEADMAEYIFGGKYQQELDTKSLNLQPLANSFNNADKSAVAASLDVAEGIANGTIAKEILDQIAESVNQAIDNSTTQIEFDKLYASALSYADLLSNGVPSYANVNSFLKLLMYALDQGGGYNLQFLNELKWFGRTITGRKRFNMKGGNPRQVSRAQVEVLEKIQRSLVSAAERFQKTNGKLSANSFRQTIVSIFKKNIAKTVAENGLQYAVKDAKQQVDNILISYNFKPLQSRSVASKKTEQVNFIDSKGMQLSVTQQEDTTIIEIGSGMNILSMGNKGSNGMPTITAKTTMGEMFNSGTPTRYYAYNLIAHRHQYPNQYNLLRGAIAANFLKEATINKQQTQIEDFILVNGKVYPTYGIIRNICDDYMKNSGMITGMIMQELQGGQNTWYTNNGRVVSPNWDMAYIRSKITNDAINKLVIGLNFNLNILTQYLR